MDPKARLATAVVSGRATVIIAGNILPFDIRRGPCNTGARSSRVQLGRGRKARLNRYRGHHDKRPRRTVAEYWRRCRYRCRCGRNEKGSTGHSITRRAFKTNRQRNNGSWKARATEEVILVGKDIGGSAEVVDTQRRF